MATDRWRLISRIYNDAYRLPDDARDAFIRDACAGDVELEREVRSLIAQPSSESAFDEMLHKGSAAVVDAASGPRPSRLGRFEVRAFLGAGGMGEVYHAHDAGLGRDVALKLLPAAFTRDSERLVRFEREARILAAISHPHIAALYGVEEIPDGDGPDGKRRALVLELVDGETLADRLRRTCLTIPEAIDIARQIADGLEAAHEKRIVHRDLKPANIKIRADGVVKILDFGLAKVIGPGRLDDASSQHPRDFPETATGAIVGTPAYMSPEQARANVVDRRTDTWAFGCVLFEMLAGQRAFRGDTPADAIAAVVNEEPDWSLLPPATPAGVRRLLHRCLEKNPKRRLRDMGDARLDLEDDAPLPPAGERTRRGPITWAVLGTAGALAIFLAIPRSEPARDLAAVRFTLDAPQGHAVIGVPVPSPDGRQLVFAARSMSGESALWVRAIDSTISRRIDRTEGAIGPFWSPDGEFVGFSVDRVLKRTAVAGGPVQRITELDPLTLGATWNHDDVIVFTPSNQAPLHRVAAGGGAPEPLTRLNSGRRENSHRWPQFLPDGRHFIFTARSELPQNTAIYVASLDNPHSATRLVTTQSAGVFVAPGYLLYLRDDTLLAQRFDATSLALTGNATAIADNVAVFAASSDGSVLTYNPVAMRRLVWRDRTGAEREVVPGRGDFSQIRLSPDESRAAVVMADGDGGRDIWVLALADGGITRVTSHPAADWFPVWSPDGSEIVFASERNETYAFYVAPAGGGGDERQIFANPQPDFVAPTDWSRDGTLVLFHSYPRADIGLLPLDTPDTPQPLVSSRFTDWLASFSPDGRWIAYVSDESGRDEVYVRSRHDSARYRVSIDGGTQPRWRGDGRELFFIGSGDRLFAARVIARTTFHSDPPVALFDACPAVPGQERSPFMYRYDVSADGARTLWTCPESGTPAPTVAIHALPAPLVR